MAANGLPLEATLLGPNSGPFCLINGATLTGANELLLLRGPIAKFDKLAEIPRKSTHPSPDTVTYDTVSMIPFCTISERGFKAHRRGERILTMQVTHSHTVSTEWLRGAIEEEPIELVADAHGDTLHFDTTREEYTAIVETVKHQMISCGEGSSFVTPRKCTGKIANFNTKKAVGIFRRLLLNEYGCYWKFLFFDGEEMYFIGASPERHLTVRHGKVEMNPISGTFRKSATRTSDEERTALLEFLNDEKEIDELCMVADEELKMMAKMCSTGGDIVGPLLKEMGALIHTEYLLSGLHTGTDLIDLFRDSMFAPTVTGSPMGNACACVYQLEKDTRSYYSSAIVLLGREAGSGTEFLDSSITIRTQEILTDGSFSVRVGATLVKDSVPASEVEETEVKIRGSIRSLTTNDPPPQKALNLAGDAEVQRELQKRNGRLSRFWMDRQDLQHTKDPHLVGRTVVLMNNEDDFAVMLRYLFTSMGFTTLCRDFSEFRDSALIAQCDAADIVVVGPGPGDPTHPTQEKMIIVREVLQRLRDRKQKHLCICLGHQIKCHGLGFEVLKKAVPTQGVQKETVLFGKPQKLGFYNAFYTKYDAAKAKANNFADVSLIGEEMIGIRGEDFVSFQFHPESILTQDGFGILRDAVYELLPPK
jgi:phenazine biosynthesis protein phzE